MNIIKLTLCVLALLLSLQNLFGQHEIQLQKSEAKIKLDGKFDEALWQSLPVMASDFITMRPKQGLDESQKTEVKITYNDEAIYIAAAMYETDTDSIRKQLVVRDNVGNTDFFGIILDTYGSGNNAFEFILQSTGVQFDARLTPTNEDSNWDAVWASAVQITDEGWFAEIEIPYSAIRFPNEETQNWNINFMRRRAANGEQSTWHPINQEQSNAWLTQIGKLNGIENISPPVRLSLLPYASAYALHSHDANRDPVNSMGYSYNVGLDLKYGINDAFTLDMTLVPDFGQVRQDDQVLNLGPAEIYFAERRPFFTEGVELFNKGGIFYSRRVGNNQQLYNATKVSGRTKKGLGVGFFNAVEASDKITYTNEETGEVTEDVIHPFTNYNVTVLDQDLKNNSYITFTNTNVLRRGIQFHNANVSGLKYNFKNEKQSIGFSGTANLSLLQNKEAENITGHHVDARLEKLNGAFRYGTYYEQFSPDYNNNDLGIIRYTHYRQLGAYARYNDFDGFGKVNRFSSWFNTSRSWNIAPDEQTQQFFNTGFWFQAQKQWSMEVWSNANLASKDFYEPRSFGRHFNKPANVGVGSWFGSDGRKAFAYELFGSYFNYLDDDWSSAEINLEIGYRFSDQISVFADSYFSRRNNEKGFVNNLGNDEIIFGERNQNLVSNVIGLNYNINSNMNIDLRIRHYWTTVEYSAFSILKEDGNLGETDYNTFSDLSYDFFTAELNYRWQFAPGSEFRALWRNNISGVNRDENISYSTLRYREGVGNLKNLPQTNSLSISLVYYLDYARDLQRKKT